MKTNRGVTFVKPGEVAVQKIDYPTLVRNNRTCEHGIIIKIVLAGICGSDEHIFRGRIPTPPGMVLGHEITGEVVECGRDVEFIKVGDLVSIPFNVACGRCANCKEQKTHLCLTTNSEHPGGCYGFSGMGGWIGGQAEYMMVPYADFNALKLPPLNQVKNKIKDLALLGDIFPTGFFGAMGAGVKVGSYVYIAGAGPVGICAAVSAQLLGAACIIVGDVRANRLERAKAIGCYTIDLSSAGNIGEQIAKITGMPFVDCAIDCVGFEAYAPGTKMSEENPAAAFNSAIDVVKPGGGIGIPGVYTMMDLKAKDPLAQQGILPIECGLVWGKGASIAMGLTPVMQYQRALMSAILNNRCNLADALGVKIISLDQAPEAYKDFAAGAACKYLIDPHGMIK
jgi:glutathione-independent formaldehyde dehydrogenase